VKTYLDELVKALPTKSDLATIKEEVINKFDELITKIKTLEDHLFELERRVEKAERKADALESQMVVRDNATELLKKAVDDQEQYGRRNSVRINGLPAGKSDDVMCTVRKCLDEMGVGDVEMDIDRAHKIGKPTINNKTGVLEQQVLIKFRSWQARTKVYRARPRGNIATRSGKFSVCLDLTKRRQALLSLARDLIANRPQFAYAFADINCNFGLKMAFGDFLKPKRSCVS